MTNTKQSVDAQGYFEHSHSSLHHVSPDAIPPAVHTQGAGVNEINDLS